MFFKKKKDGPVTPKLAREQFCCIIEENSADVKKTYHVIADESKYTLLYRDGRFLGLPQPHGGPIYPFSDDPRKAGNNGQKKKFTYAKVVCLSKDFNLKIFWGTKTPFVIEDPVTKKAYEVGAHGEFYIQIDPTDAASSADKFYSKCLTQGDANNFDTTQLRDFLTAAFIMRVGAKIQDYIEEKGTSLETYVGLTPKEMLKISNEICPRLRDVFAEYGVTVVESTSADSILQGLNVKEASR